MSKLYAMFKFSKPSIFIFTFLFYVISGSARESVNPSPLESDIADFGIIWGALKFRSDVPHDKIDSLGAYYLQKVVNQGGDESHKIIGRFISELKMYERSGKKDCGCVSILDHIDLDRDILEKLKKLVCGSTKQRVNFRDSGVPENVPFKYSSYRFDRNTPELSVLTLLYYWNAVQYLYAYRNEMEVNWISLLPMYVQKILKSDTVLEYETHFMALSAAMEDAHSYLVSIQFSSRNGWYELDSQLMYRPEKGMYVDAPGILTSNLKRGDRILTIDDISVDSLVSAYSPYVYAGNPEDKGSEIAKMCTKSNKRDHVFQIMRDGREVTIEIRYYSYQDIKDAYQSDSVALEIIDPNTCYLDIRKVTEDNYRKVFEKASEYNTLILDMRSYPYIDFIDIVNQCVLFEKKRFVKYMNQDSINIGCFNLDENSDRCYTAPKTDKRKRPFNSYVIGLVNHQTQSHVEYILQMLKTYDRFESVGSHTAGANGSVIRLQVSEGIKAIFTVQKVIDPEEGVTNGTGHIPDYVVEEDGFSGSDAILEKAISLVR
ncbi:S41 family peptidase [Membranihabitans maritimus]|uniref:S41 family peptidase n=1 Tax=Membranihabitans maritimus TaxID=2904244 RepID=UPI001F028616|nr:S41 family peptidase [Membranihabitans maritimus]